MSAVTTGLAFVGPWELVPSASGVTVHYRRPLSDGSWASVQGCPARRLWTWQHRGPERNTLGYGRFRAGSAVTLSWQAARREAERYVATGVRP